MLFCQRLVWGAHVALRLYCVLQLKSVLSVKPNLSEELKLDIIKLSGAFQWIVCCKVFICKRSALAALNFNN